MALAAVAATLLYASNTTVPGHQGSRYDQDNNGYPDVGVEVNGKYTALYAYDASDDWYWDLGDGRVQGTVDSVDDLDQSTLSTCDYQIQYRGTFENNSFMDGGWIMNNIVCSGYDGTSTNNYLIVNENDPRYTGDPAAAIWGNWEYHILTQSGEGNLVRPEHHVN